MRSANDLNLEQSQADKAYSLWRAIIELNPADYSAQFNAGYWAQDLAEKTHQAFALHWLKQAGQHYHQALSIKPDMHIAIS